MEELAETVGKDVEVFFHLDLRSDWIIEFDQSGENKKDADEKARELVEEALHIFGRDSRDYFNFIKQKTE